MKHNVIAFLLLSLLVVACSSSKIAPTADIDMTIDMQRMLPSRSVWEDIEPAYRLEIHGNEVISYLPYVWGRSIEREKRLDTLNFTAIMRGFNASVNRHGQKIYSFDVQHSVYTFNFFITINDRGTALVEISSDGCDPISFEGRVR